MCMQFPVFFFHSCGVLPPLGVQEKCQTQDDLLYCTALHYSAQPAKEEKLRQSFDKCRALSTSAANTFLCSNYLIRLLPAVFDICPTSFSNPTYLRIRSLYKFRRLMLTQILQDCRIEPVLKGWAVNAEHREMYVNLHLDVIIDGRRLWRHNNDELAS